MLTKKLACIGLVGLIANIGFIGSASADSNNQNLQSCNYNYSGNLLLDCQSNAKAILDLQERIEKLEEKMRNGSLTPDDEFLLDKYRRASLKKSMQLYKDLDILMSNMPCLNQLLDQIINHIEHNNH